MNESSYYKFFDSSFTYKKEFTLKYTMIDTQKESIYSRLYFFQRHLRGAMNGSKQFYLLKYHNVWNERNLLDVKGKPEVGIFSIQLIGRG